MEQSNDFSLESPNISDNNIVRDEKPSEPKPRLAEEIERWDREWHDATAASDLTNHVLSPVLRFYTTPGLAPYYKAKTLVFCSTAYKEDELPSDLESRRYFLERAQVALQRCQVYTHPEDCKEVQRLMDYVAGEWQGLLEVEATAIADRGDDGQAEH